MNYQRTLSYMMGQLPMFQHIGRIAFNAGLDNAKKLDEYFDTPHSNFKTVHVAGTNGKGSVSHMLASILQEAGYHTALYTSPHLVDFRERIKINGRKISKSYITEFVNEHKPFFDTFKPSFFEITQYLAFKWFRDENVNIAIIETGLGGRLDATNIVLPVLSVITNAGMDHTDMLGDTIEKIATEKAGIIKRNIPVVVGEGQPESLPVFTDIARLMESPLIVADQEYSIDYSLLSLDNCQVFNVRKNDVVLLPDLKNELLGHYQKKNTITTLAAIDRLCETGFNITTGDIYSGLENVIRNTGLRGRWQIIQDNPKVICDTAHNIDGLKTVLQQVNDTPHKKLHLVIGFVTGKDVDSIMNYLPNNALYYFTRLSVPRTMDEKVLTILANKHHLKGIDFAHIKDAIDAALKNAGPDDLIVITGSSFLVGDFLAMGE